MKIQRSRMYHPSGKATVVGPTFPNAGVQAWYQGQLDTLVREMYIDSRVVLIPALEATPVIIATDSMTPTAAGIMFTRGDRFLVLLRTDPGFESWGLPGGKIEAGETPKQAALRETWEETRFIAAADGLVWLHEHQYRTTRFVTYRYEVFQEFEPTLDHEHSDYRWITRDEATTLPMHPGVIAALTLQPYAIAMDASPTKELQRTMQKWGDKWQARFDLMAQKISLDFAAKNSQATQISMLAQLKKAGFTVAFRPTRASIEAYKVVAAEQVGLIKSIAQKYHTDVQTQVWQAVKRGGDLKTLSKTLESTYGVTKRRAALIARDQNAKAKATIEAVRLQELGIKQAIWMHSKGGKEPRPTHVAMNNKLYDLDKGMWDSDEQQFVHPGELINCRCVNRPYIPGFESVAYPEWDIAQ